MSIEKRTIEKSKLQPEIQEQVEVGRIMACIGPEATFKATLKDRVGLGVKSMLAEPVDYYAEGSLKDKRGQRHSKGVEGYVVSAINSKNKVSRGYAYCNGLVIVGVDIQKGNNISLLTHQRPQMLIPDPSEASDGLINSKKASDYWNMARQVFREELEDSLRSFMSRVNPSTVDVVTFGGGISSTDINGRYKEALAELSTIVGGVVGIEPSRIESPNIDDTDSSGHQEFTDVLFDTKNRRLYMMRHSDFVTYYQT